MLNNAKIRYVDNIYFTDVIVDPGAFAGYYAELLPERCWDVTGRRVVSEENWGSMKVVMCADVDHKKVTKITSATEKLGAWSVLDVSDNIIVAGYSSPTSAPQLVRLLGLTDATKLYPFDRHGLIN